MAEQQTVCASGEEGAGDEAALWELRRETGVGRDKNRLPREFIPQRMHF